MEAEALVAWCRNRAYQHPILRLIFHIPNGGARSPKVAEQLKREGVLAGVSDYFLPVPMRGEHGLWIELKAKTGKPSKLQEDWLQAMADLGYATRISYGADDAIRTICNYLNILP